MPYTYIPDGRRCNAWPVTFNPLDYRPAWLNIELYLDTLRFVGHGYHTSLTIVPSKGQKPAVFSRASQRSDPHYLVRFQSGRLAFVKESTFNQLFKPAPQSDELFPPYSTRYNPDLPLRWQPVKGE